MLRQRGASAAAGPPRFPPPPSPPSKTSQLPVHNNRGVSLLADGNQNQLLKEKRGKLHAREVRKIHMFLRGGGGIDGGDLTGAGDLTGIEYYW